MPSGSFRVPNEKGQNWIKNFLNQIKQEEELKEIAHLTMDPNVRSKKGSRSVNHQLCMSHTFFRMSSFLFLICFVFHNKLETPSLRRDVMFNLSFAL